MKNSNLPSTDILFLVIWISNIYLMHIAVELNI
jgi:hypothetical protein